MLSANLYLLYSTGGVGQVLLVIPSSLRARRRQATSAAQNQPSRRTAAGPTAAQDAAIPFGLAALVRGYSMRRVPRMVQ